MGQQVQRKLILTGGRTGQTCIVYGYQFVNGITIVRGDSDNISGLIKYMGRSYKAFEEGSAELAYYQKLDREAHGAGQIHPGAQPGRTIPLPSGIQPGGGEFTPVPPEVSTGPASASSGAAGLVSGGDGQQDTRDDGKAREQAVLAAIKRLDPQNGEHWTVDGIPRVDAVATLLGDPNVTRGLIEKAAPGFNRAKGGQVG